VERTPVTHNEKANNLILKWAKDLNRHLSKQDIQTANKYVKKCAASLIIREVKVKATVICHFTPLGWLLTTKGGLLGRGEGEGKVEKEKSNGRGEYEQSTLHICVETS
jgi:hypothetical protein